LGAYEDFCNVVIGRDDDTRSVEIDGESVIGEPVVGVIVGAIEDGTAIGRVVGRREGARDLGIGARMVG